MWIDNNQVDGRLPQGFRRLPGPTSRTTCFPKFMKSMTVSSMECISALTRSTFTPHDASGTANWRPALPEVPCMSKMMIAYLESFLGVSPFQKTRDTCVDARIDVLY
jgi:hypothetical protein